MSSFEDEIAKIVSLGLLHWNDINPTAYKGQEDFNKECFKREDELVEDVIELKEKYCIDRAEVIKIIDKYIVTDLQGHPEPQCEILWKIKSELGLEGEKHD